jgi:hypothetical protein
MSESDIQYEKDDDYAVVYADNVIIRMGNENSRLIFYQEVTKLNENKKGFEKNKRCKRLKFELIIPTSAIRNMSDKASYLLKLREDALMVGWNKNKNPEVLDAWGKVNKRIEYTYYDTSNPSINDKEMQDLIDSAEDLIGRRTQADKDDLK